MSETRRASRIPAYALVLFDVDKCHAVVPSKKIEGTVQENYKVRVKWNAGRKTELLDALIISLSDNKASLDQECVLRAESLVSELAQDVHCPPSSSSPNPEPSNPARKRKGSQNNGKQSKKTKSGTVKQKKREQQIVVEKACPPARQDDLEYVSEMHITPIQVDLGRRQEEVDRQVREYAVAAAAQENPDQNCETPPENATSACCSNCRQIPILQQKVDALQKELEQLRRDLQLRFSSSQSIEPISDANECDTSIPPLPPMPELSPGRPTVQSVTPADVAVVHVPQGVVQNLFSTGVAVPLPQVRLQQPTELSLAYPPITGDDEIPPPYLSYCLESSSSMKNFAKRLAFLIYSKEERYGKNCSGKNHSKTDAPKKTALSPRRLNKIRNAVFGHYPEQTPLGRQNSTWKGCMDAIDKGLRDEMAALHRMGNQ